ncbi:MAG: hypothetical protein ACK44H_08190 [Candidatus Kryptonium sp.]
MKGLVVFKAICFLVLSFAVINAQVLKQVDNSEGVKNLNGDVNTFGFQLGQIQKEKLSEKPYALGVGVGYVKPEGIAWTFWLVANGRYKFTSNLAIELEIGYWKRRFKRPSISPFQMLEAKIWYWQRPDNFLKPSEATFSDFSIGGHILLFSPESEHVQIFMGGGPAIHFFKDPLGFLGYKSSKTKVKFGVRLLSGIEVNLVWGFAVFGAARFDLISDINQFKVYGGLCYKF